MNPPTTPTLDLLRHARPRAGERPGLNILYLCHRVPYPPDKGDKIRAFHQINALARHNRVHLLTLADGAVPDLTPLREICERVEVFPVHRPAGYVRSALGVFGQRPLTLAFFESAGLRRRVEELAARERFDVIVAYSSSMAPYVEPFQGVPAVLDMVDVDSAKWGQYAHFARPMKRPVYALEAKRLRAYEASLADRFEKIVLATGNERSLYESFTPGARVTAVPNGVDFDYFHPLDLPKAEKPLLVFTGQMDYFANVDGVEFFAREVFPRLRQRFSDLELVIVGRSPVPAVRALGELPGISVTGAVGDVRPFLARSWVFVAPLRIAQGVQNKVLEAMAMDVPVVCSDRVLAGLVDGGFQHGRDLLAADSVETFESCVTTLLEDAGARVRLAEAARQRLGISYRWATNLDRFEDILVAAARQAVPEKAALASRPSEESGEQSVEGARSA